MKNADAPAIPTHDVYEHCGFDGNSGPHVTQTTNYGLTKREMMAMHALQGLLSGTVTDELVVGDERDFAETAVDYADALLAALEEKS